MDWKQHEVAPLLIDAPSSSGWPQLCLGNFQRDHLCLVQISTSHVSLTLTSLTPSAEEWTSALSSYYLDNGEMGVATVTTLDGF